MTRAASCLAVCAICASPLEAQRRPISYGDDYRIETLGSAPEIGPGLAPGLQSLP